MIEITCREYYDSSFSVAIEGHAGYAEHGKDIVCAGVSALTGALAERVRALCFRNEIALESGHAYIMGSPEAYESFATVRDGYRLIQSSYPEYVSLNEG